MVLRSFLYHAVFYVVGTAMAVLFLPVLAFRRGPVLWVARTWARATMALHQAITGIRHEYRGFERLPREGCLVAMKHQSTWETIALVPRFRDPAFVLKRELTWIPLFGWYLNRAGMIAIDRGRGTKALAAMVARARAAAAEGREILIFPEGTRREAGAPPTYKVGIAHLYRDLGVPIVPIALNSGVCWPRKSLLHRRGTIVAEVLPPIPPGLDPRVAFERLQLELEAASDRLLLESADRGDDLPETARARVAELRAGAPTRITARG